jgi:hypothetical protein
MSNISRAIIDALLPKGSLWIPELGADFDLLLDGIADNEEATRVFLEKLATIRDPLNTFILDDLEKEFGIVTDTSVAEADRRARLLAAKTDRVGDGTDDFLQSKLQDAGFDVFVYENEPLIDPRIFLNPTYQTYFLGHNAYMGWPTSFMRLNDALLIANGLTLDVDFPKTIPADPGYWPLIFFIGGPATFSTAVLPAGSSILPAGSSILPASGELLTIEDAVIPEGRREELVRLIVKYKPIRTWAILRARYT